MSSDYGNPEGPRIYGLKIKLWKSLGSPRRLGTGGACPSLDLLFQFTTPNEKDQTMFKNMTTRSTENTNEHTPLAGKLNNALKQAKAKIADARAKAERQRMASSKLLAAFVVVTPSMAALWLHGLINVRNRKVAFSHVDKMVSDMRNGEWVVNGSGVQFDSSGTCIDGQHRLHAVIRYGKPVCLLVVRGLSKEAKGVIDGGKVRDVADLLNWRNPGTFSNARRAAAIGRAIAGGGTPGERDAKSKLAQARYVEAHKTAILWADEVLAAKERGVTRASVPGVIARAFYHEKESKLRRFCELLTMSGKASSGEAEGNVLKLREYLRKANLAGHKSAKLSYRITEWVLVEFCRGTLGNHKIVDYWELPEVGKEHYLLPKEKPFKYRSTSKEDRKSIRKAVERAERIAQMR